LAFEFEKVHLKNLETKKQLDEKRDKSDEELVELQKKISKTWMRATKSWMKKLMRQMNNFIA